VHSIASLFARRERETGRPSCVACERTVGMFGPIWVEHRDGSIEPASWHALSSEGRRTVSRAFHAGCFVPDFVPEWMRSSDQFEAQPAPSVARHRSFRMTAPRLTGTGRAAAATLSLACSAVTALDAVTVALHAVPS